MSSILSSARLETRREGPKVFFTSDVQQIVLEACRRHNISFDAYAAKLGSNRASLVLMLKGHDAVPLRMLDSLREFVATAYNDPRSASTAA